jgi:hypothetical protein
MAQLILSGNALTRLKLQALALTHPGAHIGDSIPSRCISGTDLITQIGLSDSYSLFADMDKFAHLLTARLR